MATVIRRLVLTTAKLQRKGLYLNACCRCLSTRLAEVGVLEPPRENGLAYDSGQLFLHKIFGYRGVILFHWFAHVYDRDAPGKNDDRLSEDQTFAVGKEVKARSHLYYQVLIDSRDSVHIRAQTEAVTFLGTQDNSRALYSIPGLDYVGHEDILPYVSPETTRPIQHELYDRFLKPDIIDPDAEPEENANKDLDLDPGSAFPGNKCLQSWQAKNHTWLTLSDVHRETTEGIRVTVIPFYMGCRDTQQTHVYWWRYCVRLENQGEESVQLRERHWRIFSLSGTLETVRGRGVVGQEPLLTPSQAAFQYSSHISLQAPSGHMWGTFKMERRDGTSFDCKIPPFSLESKYDDSNNPHPLLEG